MTQTLVLQKYQTFNNLTNWNTLDHVSLLLLDMNFNQWHQTLLFLSKKTFDCFKSYQMIQTPFQNQLCTILEGDTPRGRAWETSWKIGSQETFTKLWTLGAVPRSSELLGRGMRCVTACANIARTQRTQIRITSYLLRRKLGGAAVQIKSLAAEFRHKAKPAWKAWESRDFQSRSLSWNSSFEVFGDLERSNKSP